MQSLVEDGRRLKDQDRASRHWAYKSTIGNVYVARRESTVRCHLDDEV